MSTNAATVLIDGTGVDVLGPLQSERYLGRKICFGSYHETEIKNRISEIIKRVADGKTEYCKESPTALAVE